jgi:hypothetical protein
MTRLPALLLCAALLLAAGCGDDGGGPSSTAVVTVTAPELDCPEPRIVTSAEDITDELSALIWEGLGAYSSGVLPITSDLVIIGSIALNASALPVPNDCLQRSDCSPQAGLILDSAVTGAVGEGDANLECGDSYSRVILTDTTVRLRPYLGDTHPCRYNAVPMVVVMPPCGTACGEGQGLCPADGVCYELGTGYCQACEGGTKEVCACRGPEGPLAEGASCRYWQSGDVLCEGHCRQGGCDAGPCP